MDISNLEPGGFLLVALSGYMPESFVRLCKHDHCRDCMVRAERSWQCVGTSGWACSTWPLFVLCMEICVKPGTNHCFPKDRMLVDLTLVVSYPGGALSCLTWMGVHHVLSIAAFFKSILALSEFDPTLLAKSIEFKVHHILV
jgi:hypothetical protein